MLYVNYNSIWKKLLTNIKGKQRQRVTVTGGVCRASPGSLQHSTYCTRGPQTSAHPLDACLHTTIHEENGKNKDNVASFFKKSNLLHLKHVLGLPWWRSGWESACQCRGHGFEPWSGKIPHAAEQLGPCATTTEPACLEPVPRNKRPRQWEACAPRWRVALACRN